MTDFGWLLSGAVAVALMTVVVAGGRLRGTGRPSARQLRVAGGLLIVLVAMGAGMVLAGVQSEPAPEQRGVGVLVEGASSSKPRGFDLGLALSMSVTVTACNEDVRVRLTLAPTAEFWADNQRTLPDPVRVRLAVPDGEPAVDVTVLDDVRASLSTDGLAPFVSALVAPRDTVAEAPEVAMSRLPRLTVLDLEVPDWTATKNPLNIDFRADWTVRRTFLGGCYVTLPALAGFPTVLSAAQMDGQTVGTDDPLPTERTSFFVVSSTDADLRAYYRTDYEVTRGVTALNLPGHSLQEGVSLPGPNANFGGSPAWTCRTSIPTGPRLIDLVGRGEETLDVNISGIADGTFALGADRIDEILDQRTCASFVAIESNGAGTRRDLLLMVIGAVFAFGVELLLAGAKRNVAPHQ